MDIYDNINDKCYEHTGPYPVKPRMPEILHKTVINLSNEELATIPKVRAQHEKELDAYKEAVTAYNKARSALEAQYIEDLFEYCKMERTHPFAQKLFAMAWDKGHSSGHYEVAQIFENLVDELFECAVKHGMHRHVKGA